MEKPVEQLRAYRNWARDELRRAVDFWLTHGMDAQYGGVYTCLDREGNIYSTDKSVWMQGRCGWIFSYLCHVYGARPEWMAAAKSCLDFMEQHCINREAGNRMYFTVTADGRPLRQRRYCFSEGFYCMANAEYYGLTHEPAYLERARAAYELIYQLNHRLIADPTGLGPKTIPTTRSGRSLADPMIYLNITSILRRCDPRAPGAVRPARAGVLRGDSALSLQAGAGLHAGDGRPERRTADRVHRGAHGGPRPRHRVRMVPDGAGRLRG